MRVKDFEYYFEDVQELEEYLKKQSKQYLYYMFMEDVNHDGVGYRKITKKQLIELFITNFEEKKMWKEVF